MSLPHTFASSCLACLNFLCTVFTVYANSVILNKNTVSCVRMIDYGSEARSPQRSRECCLSRTVNTISALYECHQQSNDLLLGRFCSFFFFLFLICSPFPLSLILGWPNCTFYFYFFEEWSKFISVPAWSTLSFEDENMQLTFKNVHETILGRYHLLGIIIYV